MPDLLAFDRRDLQLDPGATLLARFALRFDRALLDAVAAIASAAPFRYLETPGGRRMSVAMTNAGRLGWISDRRGYRYGETDPLSGLAWPAMPPLFRQLASEAAAAAGFDRFEPEACLVNRYEPGAKLSLHQDRDERNLDQPIVSISLGVDAAFLWGGQARGDRTRRIMLFHGDVVVWGGPARLTYHGVDTLARAVHPLTGEFRYNLTFRRAACSGCADQVDGRIRSLYVLRAQETNVADHLVPQPLRPRHRAARCRARCRQPADAAHDRERGDRNACRGRLLFDPRAARGGALGS